MCAQKKKEGNHLEDSGPLRMESVKSFILLDFTLNRL